MRGGMKAAGGTGTSLPQLQITSELLKKIYYGLILNQYDEGMLKKFLLENNKDIYLVADQVLRVDLQPIVLKSMNDSSLLKFNELLKESILKEMIDQKYIELSKRRIELEDLITELKAEYKKPLAPDKDIELEIRLFQHILKTEIFL